MIRSLPILLVGICLGSVQCQRDLEDSELELNCKEFCQTRGCEDGVDPDACVSDCVGQEDAAEAVGKDCVDVFHGLVACIAELECPDAGTWWAFRKIEGLALCGPERDEFWKVCPGVWFSPMQPMP